MPRLPIIDSLRRRWKRSFPSDVLKGCPAVNLKEGEEIVLTYTAATDKMGFFSAFIQGGLEGGDVVWYSYPDEESGTVRAKLGKHGIDVEKYEKDGTLHMLSQVEYFMPNGKLDFEQAIVNGLDWWDEVKARGYKHARSIEDFGDFSFVNGEWRKLIAEYWSDPRWDDPNVSKWVLPQFEKNLGVVMSPFLMDITAINVEHMTETEINEFVKATKGEFVASAHAYIDLFGFRCSFSGSIGLDHQGLIGRRILLEYDPLSNYEKVVESLAKESMANVQPIFIFASNTASLHTYLGEHPAIKFFLTSIATSTPKSISKNEVLLPAKSVSLILDSLSEVLEAHAGSKVCFIFDILSDLLILVGPEKTFTFLRHALDMLSSEKTTSLFLLNAGAHELQVVSRIRDLFTNLLTYEKDGLKVIKTS